MPPRKSTSSAAATETPPRASTPSKPRSRTKSTGSTGSARKTASSAVAKRNAAAASAGLLSEHVYVTYAAYLFAFLSAAFGVNAIVRPKHGITFFELDYPTLIPKQQLAVDVMTSVYGFRDIFMGTAILIAVVKGTRKSLGYTLLSFASQAFFDGAVCYVKVGKGQWNHWSWFPLPLALGVLALGCLDK